jgi:predicted site-specific integrase-resolvase
MPKFFTVNQALRYHDGLYSKATLQRWLLTGEVKGMRLAGPMGKWVIPEDEVLRLTPQEPNVYATQGQV